MRPSPLGPAADLPMQDVLDPNHILLADHLTPAILPTMHATKYIIWEEDGQWHGYLQDYPNLPTQGDSFEDLQMKLSDLHCEMTNGTDDQYHTPAYTIPQCTRPRTKRHERVEQLFRTMLYDL
jgi:hypothetical protein